MLGGCTEQCLKLIRDFTGLVNSLPEQLDFDLTPFLKEDLSPLVRSGDQILANELVSRLNVKIAYFE